MAQDISIEARKILMNNLQSGQVVEYKYRNDSGEWESGKAPICKANRGIVVMKAERSNRIICFNASGTIYKKNGVGSTKLKSSFGKRAYVEVTGETADVWTDAMNEWHTDYWD